MMTELPPAIFLMGPTASGKTAAAVRLVKNLPVEIISVDSALVYKGFHIGAARPDEAALVAAPHRLINFIDPADAYSAGRYRDDARAAMVDITANGKIPLLVGGTMLYYRALMGKLADLPDADPVIRVALEKEGAAVGWPAMHEQLQSIDPQAASRIQPNDPQRIVRALEVFQLTGQPLTTLQQTLAPKPLPYRVLKLALAPAERAVLHARIEQRFQQMLVDGLQDEVAQLFQRDDLGLHLPSIKAVGYRQMWQYLSGDIDYDQMVHDGVVATRRLAKRQLTWLRSDAELHWIDSLQENYFSKIETLVIDFIEKKI